jgi:hypothetical protein
LRATCWFNRVVVTPYLGLLQELRYYIDVLTDWR